jgi:hypothetical protein
MTASHFHPEIAAREFGTAPKLLSRGSDPIRSAEDHFTLALWANLSFIVHEFDERRIQSPTHLFQVIMQGRFTHQLDVIATGIRHCCVRVAFQRDEKAALQVAVMQRSSEGSDFLDSDSPAFPVLALNAEGDTALGCNEINTTLCICPAKALNDKPLGVEEKRNQLFKLEPVQPTNIPLRDKRVNVWLGMA